MLDSGSPRRLRTLGCFGARLPDSGDRPTPPPQSRPDHRVRTSTTAPLPYQKANAEVEAAPSSGRST